MRPPSASPCWRTARTCSAAAAKSTAWRSISTLLPPFWRPPLCPCRQPFTGARCCRCSGTSEWRTEFLYEYFWERDYPQTPSMLGLRTDRYSYTNYHGVWDLDELYDLQQDPDQMHNLLGDVRITTQGGSLFAQIKDPERKRLVGDLRNRMFRILANTGGRREPTWSA